MIQWRPLQGTQQRLFSPIALQLVDDFTGELPAGALDITLLEIIGLNNFVPTGVPAVITPLGCITYPGLGRQALVANQAPRQFLVQLDAELYRPLYRNSAPGIAFSALPYNDVEPAAGLTPTLAQMILLPAFQYQFPAYVPVLRGEVLDASGRPVADALVMEPTTGQKVLSDERGAFSLPLRRLAGPQTINVSDVGNLRHGTLPNLQVPDDLGHGYLITIV